MADVQRWLHLIHAVVPQALETPKKLIVARSESPHQLAIATLRTLEQRLRLLEAQGRYECAYALRMEVAEWLLGAMDDNLAVPAAT